MTAQSRRRRRRWFPVALAGFAIVAASVPAAAQVRSPADYVGSPSDLFPPPGVYVGTIEQAVDVGGFMGDGITLAYAGSWNGPATYTIADDVTGEGTWSLEATGTMTFSGKFSGTRSFSMSESGSLDGGNRGFLMKGSGSGTSSGSGGSVTLTPWSVGPYEVNFTLIDCNLVWAEFAPDLLELARGVGWKTGWVEGQYYLTRVPEPGDEAQYSAEMQAARNSLQWTTGAVNDLLDVTFAAAEAGQQPDMTGFAPLLASMEEDLTRVARLGRCRDDDTKAAQWRTTWSNAMLDNLLALLALSGETITYSGETLNEFITLAARAGSLGQGSASGQAQAFDAALGDAMADTLSAQTGQDAAVARADRRMGNG